MTAGESRALGNQQPSIASTAWIAPGAWVVGDVTLAEGSSVWFGAVLRGDTEPIAVGENSNIQDGCVLHTDPGFPLRIGAGVTVGHRAVLHGCVVESGSLIGMGAVVLNGARIGSGSIVGAGALVPEGKSIPERSLAVGVPSRVVRELDESEMEGLRQSAEGYRLRAERYRQELRHAGEGIR